MKKRILALLLIATMIFSAVPVSAVSSGTEPTFVVETVKAAAGETVDVTVEVVNNPGVASIKLEATYDANLTLNSITYNSAIGGMFMQPQKLTSPVILNWFNGAANSNGDWVFATLSFTVADTAAAGTYPITISYEADNVYNIDEINLDFAIQNGGVKVVCPHTNKTEVPAKSADCVNPGNNLYYTCDACGAAFKADGTETTVEAETIAALGHDYADATCTAPKTCKVCGATEGETLGHSFTNYVSNNDATCTADGTKTAKCDRCDATDTKADAGSAKGHDYADATCTAPKTCKVCGVTEGEALGHELETEWSKGDASGHWHACTRCDGHDTPVAHIPGSAATEDDPQLCTVCGYVIQPALGHTHRTTKVEGHAATCTEDGQKTYYVCEGCGLWFEDATANVEITDHDSVILASSHDWQDATCTAPKTCKVCGETEGEVNGHTASDWMTDETSHWKVCTVCEEVIDGSKADHADENKDGKCDGCGYTMMQHYEVIEGMDGKWTVNSDETLTFRADGEFSRFTGIKVDGTLVDPCNYTATSGSTVVTLKAEYLKTLSIGKHTLTVVFKNGSASTNFEIKAASEEPADPSMPQTGDNYLFPLWTALLLVSAAGIITLVIVGKKKQHDAKYVK